MRSPRALIIATIAASSVFCQAPAEPRPGVGETVVNELFAYLNMAGAKHAAAFRPLSQEERNRLYAKALVNPVWYFKGAFSAAGNQLMNKPPEWGQGMSGYGKRYGDIMGLYAIQKTVTYGFESVLHEDNRYFGSGKKGVWRRTAYAVAGSFLARREDGKRYPSVSLIGGFAAAAFISRVWQPPSTRSAGDAAVSFGWSIGYNALAAIPKEFLPDLARKISNRRKPKIP